MKIITTILAFLMPLLMMAQTTTDDSAVASGKLLPGDSEAKVLISLMGSQYYTGYEMDITLPEGVELNYYDGQPDVSLAKEYGMYPLSGRDGYTHSITTSYGEVGAKTIRIGCLSTSNQNFTQKTGPILTIYLKVSLFAKPGPCNLSLSNCKFITYDSSTAKTTGYTPTQTTITGLTIDNNATAQLSVSAENHWGTLMLPFTTTTLPADVKAYSCSRANDESLILTPATEVQAFTPYIIYSDNGYSGIISGTITDFPQTDIQTSGYLNAAVTPQTLTAGYVLQKHDSGVQFYAINPNAPVTVQPGKCWVELPQTQASKPSFGFVINNSTGITELSAQSADGTYHTLSGIKVSTPQPGTIYIHNGKKVIR